MVMKLWIHDRQKMNCIILFILPKTVENNNIFPSHADLDKQIKIYRKDQNIKRPEVHT